MTEKQQSTNFTQDQTPIFTDEPGDPEAPPSPARSELLARLGRDVAQRLYDSWAEDLTRVGDAYAAGVIGRKTLLVAVGIACGHLTAYRPEGPLAQELGRYEGFVAFVDPSAGPDGASKHDGAAPESGSGTEVATSNSKSKRIRKFRK